MGKIWGGVKRSTIQSKSIIHIGKKKKKGNTRTFKKRTKFGKQQRKRKRKQARGRDMAETKALMCRLTRTCQGCGQDDTAVVR